MKIARLVCSVFAVTLIAGWATQSFACDSEKSAAASAAMASGCTAEMAAKCTPEMMAACKAMKTTTAKTSRLKADAVAASASGECSAHAMKAAAVVASASAMDACCEAKSATAKNASKKATKKPAKNTMIHFVNATPEGAADAVYAASSSSGSCASKGASVSAVNASANGSCASKNTAAYTASANGSCASKGTSVSAVNAGAKGAKQAGACAPKNSATAGAGQCVGHGMAVIAGMSSSEDCEACFDMAACGDALSAVGAHRQAVRLKNGVMYVFTADSRRDVSAVQTAVSRRGDQMARILTSGDNVKLCADCKTFRGAIASGKLTREVVNIEGGTLTLITSSDAGLVTRLHAMADTKVAAARIKS